MTKTFSKLVNKLKLVLFQEKIPLSWYYSLKLVLFMVN